MLDIVILAAGKGTRMKSELPKVLHPVAGRPLLSHVLDTARELGSDNINVVVGHGADRVISNIGATDVVFVEQVEQLGTGHAVQQAMDNLRDDAVVLVLYGDVPLTRESTLRTLIDLVDASSMGLLTIDLEDPSGYGRILRDAEGKVTAIVEQKDANVEQQLIREINTGMMALSARKLKKWLPQLSNDNAQEEYLLTDIIALACLEGTAIKTTQPDNELEVLGVNNRQQQVALERYYQSSVASQLMCEGVTLFDPLRFDCRGDLQVGTDVVIDINCIFEGKVSLGNNVSIGPHCTIKDAIIGDNVIVKANSVIEQAEVANNCEIGPFARLRPGTKLARSAKVGNFVETKKTEIGEGSKVNHLSYIGDTTIGAKANIGAGTITCNYDGVNKYQTQIGDEAFIGSNSSLVAPVSIGKGATVGAGSTINRDIKDKQLSVARSRQQNIDGWKRPTKK